MTVYPPKNQTMWIILKHCPREGTHIPAFSGPLGYMPLCTVSEKLRDELGAIASKASNDTGSLHTVEAFSLSDLPSFYPRYPKRS